MAAMTWTMSRVLTVGLVGLGLSAGAPGSAARADQDFNLIAAASLAVIGAGMIGDHIRGNDIWAPGPDEPFRVALGAGIANVNPDNEADGDTLYGLFRAEARLPVKLWRFTPIAGVEVTHVGSVYGYGGLALDVFFGENLLVTPSAALGLYSAGGGRDLGYPLEFRTGLEVAWQFEGGSRLGLAYHHISNAELGDSNPGIENLTVNLALPLGMMFRE
jgi:hypothetical protein